LKLAVIVPVFNEGERLKAFLELLVPALFSLPPQLAGRYEAYAVVLVDDGSKLPVTPEAPKGYDGDRLGIYSLRHLVNLGQGAALQTGIAYARDLLGCDAFVTMDADGQHQPDDLPTLLAALDDADMVFGNRFAEGAPPMPRLRRLLLKAAVGFESLVTGVRLHDAHNGFRCFNRRTADLMHLRQNRMAHATEFKQIVAREKLRYREAPVHIRYTSESLRKGQKNIGSLVILKELVRAYLFGS
jgi:polyprenyl-phospho-N-acetylgalactosaminyl synthase